MTAHEADVRSTKQFCNAAFLLYKVMLCVEGGDNTELESQRGIYSGENDCCTSFMAQVLTL